MFHDKMLAKLVCFHSCIYVYYQVSNLVGTVYEVNTVV